VLSFLEEVQMPDSGFTGPTQANIDLDRLANMCSVGFVPIPGDLSLGDMNQLLRLIAQARRNRLVDFLARSIADDIVRERQTEER
jgi:hypothetical protein